jgi:hypothetical protein
MPTKTTQQSDNHTNPYGYSEMHWAAQPGGASYQPSGQRRVQPYHRWRPCDTVARRWSPLCAWSQRRLFPCDPHAGWARGHVEAAVGSSDGSDGSRVPGAVLHD